MVAQGRISPEEMDFFKIIDDPAEVVREIKDFYVRRVATQPG